MPTSTANSCNSRGPWMDPEDGCQTVAWKKIELTGPQSFSAQLPLPDKAKAPTTTLAVFAIPAEVAVMDPTKLPSPLLRPDRPRALTKSGAGGGGMGIAFSFLVRHCS